MNWYRKARALSEEDEKELIEELDKPKWIPVESSFISGAAYFEPLSLLEVKFKNGKEYIFDGVPKKVFEDFISAKSKGEFFNRVIKKNYGSKNK